MSCKTCKHWKSLGNLELVERTHITTYTAYRYSEEKEECDNKKNLKILGSRPSCIGKCFCDKFVYTRAGGCIEDDVNATPIDGLGYSDGEAWFAYFITGMGFECKHYKEV